ncbi:bifunctional metallophosphatase/5'-nucleotidase [Halomarina litorea]|uniref:bifunctional metallophosphatase/5'-nucleotidase n=1 Tax=Halomarina litorea TaxID=2961595 RepID=UPI0020C27D5C|nr:bifunctional metallophosphatase/5'-nucleotidase [Halomarina sp. BCD28]
MTPRVLHYSDIEGVYDHPDRLARLAGRIAELRDDRTLVCGSGDNTAPGVLSLVSRGRQALPFFERVRPDADTFGNHDFDYGPDRTRELVRESPQRWVSANLSVEGDPFGAAAGVERSVVVECDGARVGLTGVIDPAATDLTTEVGTVRATDPVEAVGREIGRMRERGAEYLVVLSHLGAGDDELARRFDLDAVLGGHVHAERAEVVAGTPCTRPGPNGHRVMEVDLATGETTVHPVADATPDTDLLAEFERLAGETGLDEVVGHVDPDWPVERTRELRTSGECRIGNVVADAYRWAAGSDVGLHNAGGIRDGPPLVGEVTVADLVSVVPFGEPVSVAELSGRALRGLFEEAYRAPHGEDRWTAHVSGCSVTYDTDARELCGVTVGGDPLDPDATYTVATNDFLLRTPAEFPTLVPEHRIGTLDTQYEVLAAYAREEGIDPELSGRIDLAGRAEPAPRTEGR